MFIPHFLVLGWRCGFCFRKCARRWLMVLEEAGEKNARTHTHAHTCARGCHGPWCLSPPLAGSAENLAELQVCVLRVGVTKSKHICFFRFRKTPAKGTQGRRRENIFFLTIFEVRAESHLLTLTMPLYPLLSSRGPMSPARHTLSCQL